MLPVTLKEIAQSLGVSTMTVSRAVRGVGRISPATQARILLQARTMGYHANPIARSLRRSGQPSRQRIGLNLALVIFGNSERFRPAEEEAAARGHSLGIFNTSTWPSLAALRRSWKAQGIDGIFIHSHGPPNDKVAEEVLSNTDWLPLSVIKLGNGCPELEVNRVRTSVFTQAMTSFERVVSAGYERIAFLCHASSSPGDDDMRLGAILAAEAKAPKRKLGLTHWSIENQKHPLWEYLCSKKSRRKLDKLMHDFRPDAVIGFGSIIHSWLLHCGYRIPEDFGFASIVVNPNQFGEIAGTIEDFFGGEFVAALEMIEDQLSRGERGIPALVREHTIPVQWIPGPSLPVKTDPNLPA